MKRIDFWQENQALLEDFVAMSHGAAARVDYIQGGGGNTSVKVAKGLMAIKASGYSMGDIAPDNAYAVLDGPALRDFYLSADPDALPDMEAAGSAAAKAATLTLEGMPSLRPSVEAGFHSVLNRFVLHTHSVYANLASCSKEGVAAFSAAMEGAPYGWASIPYVDPGARLTFTIMDALKKGEAEQGTPVSLLLMENHGIIAHAHSLAEADRIHEDANERLARQYNVSKADFPPIAIGLTGEENRFLSATPYLQQRLQGGAYGVDFFTAESLYPDQMVFLGGNLAMAASPAEAATSQAPCCIDMSTGLCHYRCPRNQALVIEQTLCCVLFITETIRANGETVRYMNDSGKHFIANWESEKYRQSLVKE